MYGNKGVDYEYKIDEVNVASKWNPNAKSGKEFGGFNYADESAILRWLHRGDTLYDVLVPKDAENIKVEGATTIYRCNKIILTNPRKVTDDIALDFYKKSNIPKDAYYKVLGVVSIMDYKQTALQIFNDKINHDTIDIALEEWNDFIINGGDGKRANSNETVKLINDMLENYKRSN